MVQKTITRVSNGAETPPGYRDYCPERQPLCCKVNYIISNIKRQGL